DAKAVKANFDHIADPATKSRSAIGELGPYAGTKVLGSHTVQVVFKQPYAAFLDEMTQPAGMMSSPAAIKSGGANYGQHPVGSGPFMFKEWVQGKSVTIVRTPAYTWGRPAFRAGGPILDELTFRIRPDTGSRANA